MDAITMMESKMTPESVKKSRLLAEQEIAAIRLSHSNEKDKNPSHQPQLRTVVA